MRARLAHPKLEGLKDAQSPLQRLPMVATAGSMPDVRRGAVIGSSLTSPSQRHLKVVPLPSRAARPTELLVAGCARSCGIQLPVHRLGR